mmetsp:Transcript_2894/g.8239  ORF Transcript_2894/g.8239 Transcript_2894/m.8239 type:complete len:254 (+) Transcript_2894:200-961(+)
MRCSASTSTRPLRISSGHTRRLPWPTTRTSSGREEKRSQRRTRPSSRRSRKPMSASATWTSASFTTHSASTALLCGTIRTSFSRTRTSSMRCWSTRIGRPGSLSRRFWCWLCSTRCCSHSSSLWKPMRPSPSAGCSCGCHCGSSMLSSAFSSSPRFSGARIHARRTSRRVKSGRTTTRSTCESVSCPCSSSSSPSRSSSACAWTTRSGGLTPWPSSHTLCSMPRRLALQPTSSSGPGKRSRETVSWRLQRKRK